MKFFGSNLVVVGLFMSCGNGVHKIKFDEGDGDGKAIRSKECQYDESLKTNKALSIEIDKGESQQREFTTYTYSRKCNYPNCHCPVYTRGSFTSKCQTKLRVSVKYIDENGVTCERMETRLCGHGKSSHDTTSIAEQVLNLAKNSFPGVFGPNL